MTIPKNGELWVFYNEEEKIDDQLEDALWEVLEPLGYIRVGSGYGLGGFELGVARDIQFRREEVE